LIEVLYLSLSELKFSIIIITNLIKTLIIIITLITSIIKIIIIIIIILI